MSKHLQGAIKQQRPFRSLEQEVYLNLLRTADFLQRGVEDLLKPSRLSGTQYNVLRILRGAGSGGVSCGEVGGRMLTHDPDITRLLDRLETRGLVRRSREQKDRRVITTRITPRGVKLLAGLDRPVEALHRRTLAHLGRERLRQLVELLEFVRRD